MRRRRRRALARLLPRVLGMAADPIPAATSIGKDFVMQRIRQPRFLTATSLALVAAALVTGAAQAERPDDRAGALGVGSVRVSQAAVPDVFERAVARATTAPRAAIRPDDRAGRLGVGSVSSAEAATPDAFERAVARATPATAVATRPDDRAEPRGPGIVFSVPPAVAEATADRFEWVDASIGAALTLAAILVGAGLGAAVRDRRRIGLS